MKWYDELDYRLNNTLEKRLSEHRHISNKYPGSIPIFVESDKKLSVKTKKYIIGNHYQFGTFIYAFRKKNRLMPSEAFFFFTKNNTVISSTSPMSSLFKEHGSDDGMLYIRVSKESCYG